MLRVVIFEDRGLAGSEGARRDDHERLAFHDGDPLLGLALPGLDLDLAEALDGFGGVTQLDFIERRGRDTGRGRRARSTGNLPASDSQAAIAWSYFFSSTWLWPIWKSSSGTRAIERVLRNEVGPCRARGGKPRSRQVVERRSGAGCRGLRAGRRRSAGRSGNLRQVSLPGGDRLGELLLALKDRADLERCVHGELGPIAAGLGRLEPEPGLASRTG